ncbi:MAG: hypothetical protein AAF288_05265 [Planctomycetota bacterium]
MDRTIGTTDAQAINAMAPLQTSVLRHRGTAPPTADHYDWLLERPRQHGDPSDSTRPASPAKLATWRIADAPIAWPSLGQTTLQALPDHRRAWLTRSGPVTQGPGYAVQVDTGVATPQLWTPSRILLVIELRQAGPFCAELSRLRGDRWRAVFTP